MTVARVLAEEVAEALDRAGRSWRWRRRWSRTASPGDGAGGGAGRRARGSAPRAPSRPRSGSWTARSGSGLADAELERFAAAGTRARKAGARDLAAAVVQGALGATTVGGTLAVCRAAGIRFLATGGIGGVHRGFALSLDISADLPQIARTPAVVVSSGAKSILDVGATAELLETLGVPVLGWRTADAAAVLHRATAARRCPRVVTAAAEVAAIAAAHWQLNGTSGCCWPGRPRAGWTSSPCWPKRSAGSASEGDHRPVGDASRSDACS